MTRITGDDAQIVGHGLPLLGMKCTINARKRRNKTFYMTQTGKKIVFTMLLGLLSAHLFCEPADDNLENSLTYLFTGDFGYTLIGEKPVSIDECQNFYLHSHPDETKKLLGFLEKSFADSDRFVFKIFSYKENFNRIELINKPAIANVLASNDHLKRFIKKKYDGDDELFFNELTRPDVSVFDLFDDDAFLIGIALGYGVSNSEYFCRRCDVGGYLRKYPLVCLLPFNPKPRPGATIPNRFYGFFEPNSITPLKQKKWFSSLSDEWEWIKKVRWDIWRTSRPKPPYYVALPFYICRHGGDSERVMARYVCARAKLAKLFCSKKPSEVVAQEALKK